MGEHDRDPPLIKLFIAYWPTRDVWSPKTQLVVTKAALVEKQFLRFSAMEMRLSHVESLMQDRRKCENIMFLGLGYMAHTCLTLPRPRAHFCLYSDNSTSSQNSFF